MGGVVKLAFDIEGNNLLPKITKVWCIVTQDVDTEEMKVFHEYAIFKRDGTLEDGVRYLMKASQLICHNVLGYDHFVLKKFFKFYKYKLSNYRDTLIQSRVQWFDRPKPKGIKGTHGLAAWGARFGIPKPEIEDWSYFDKDKLHRCIEDVKIQTKTFLFLEKERLKALDQGIDFLKAMKTDHRYRYVCTNQEITGANLDEEFARKCVVELDGFIAELAEEIEPLLPPTVKIKSQKTTWKDVGDILGWKEAHWKQYKKLHETIGGENKSRHFANKIKYEHRERKGEVKEYPVKTAAKPTTKISMKNGKYLKKVAEYFDISQDRNKSDELIGGPFSKVLFETTRLTQHEQVKNYLRKRCDWEPTEWNYKKDKAGGFVRDDSGQLIPTSPKLTEDSYASITGDLGEGIAKYNTYSHRRRFLENTKDDEKGIINLLREDGRLSCGVNCFNTATGRASHNGWVNAAGVGALYGENIRSLIIPSEGNVLVGADMKSAQLSIAAYYANNYDYYIAVADGQEEVDDPNNPGKKIYIGESGHCVNARAFGLVSEEEWKRAIETQDETLLHQIMLQRKLSKGGTFATLFGASGKKVASTLGIPEKQGNAAKNRFLEDIGLDEPIRRLTKMMKKYKRGAGGYIELPFDYWVWCKSPHKLFNYLDQGTEAVCQKIAVIYFEQQLKKRKLNKYAAKIMDYHDEFLVDSTPEAADEVGALMCESYKYASDECFKWHQEHSKWFKDLTFAFNLDGGYKIGYNYLQVH